MNNIYGNSCIQKICVFATAGAGQREGRGGGGGVHPLVPQPRQRRQHDGLRHHRLRRRRLLPGALAADDHRQQPLIVAMLGAPCATTAQRMENKSRLSVLFTYTFWLCLDVISYLINFNPKQERQ